MFYQSAIRPRVSKTVEKEYSIPVFQLEPGIVAWHVSWLIHLGGRGCQCGCSVIYTTSADVPEHIFPCGPGAQIASGPEDVRVYACLHVCVCDSVSVIMWVQQEAVLGSLGAWFQVPGPVNCHKFQNGDYLLQK